MRKITLLVCFLFTLNGIAQSWEFKTSQSTGGWVKGTQTLDAAIVADGLEITWIASTPGGTQIKPKVKHVAAAINTDTNKIMALTLINNSSEPIDLQVKYTKAAGGDKFFGGTTFNDIPASVTTSTTYYFDMTDDAWTGTVNAFEIQMRDTGNTGRDNASTAGSIIFQEIAFIEEIPATPGTITSAAAGNWNTGTTWVGGVVPTIINDVIINHEVEIARDDAVGGFAKSITCNGSPAQIIIRENTKLTVDGDVTLTRSNDAIYIYGQLAGTKTGTMIFGGNYTAGKKTKVRKRLTVDKWFLISNPFLDPNVNLTTTDVNTKLVTNSDGTLLSLASYDDSNAPGSKYVYYTSGPIANSVKFGTAQGYSILVNDTSGNDRHDYIMTGVQHSGSVSYTLSTGGNGFNLVGNPYFSYLYANDAADASNNVLRVNGSNGSNVLVEDTIWLWDGDNTTWVTKNLSDGAYHINPLQGFFVKAQTAGSFSFTKAMETHDSNGDAFFRSSSNDRFEIDLSIASGELTRSASIRYIDNTSPSFDNGYDSSVFGGYSSSLEVYTGLVENNSGEKLAIQSLPNTNYEDMIIPVGVTATANSGITFSLEALNVPEDYEVHLEDRTQGIFTRLDLANAEYNATVVDASTEGRFFLHTKTSELLNVDSEFLNSISIYKTDNSNLRIAGLKQGKASVKLYDVLGKQIMTTFFIANNGVKNISLPTLARGVYVVQLETETGKLSKKIIL